MSQATTGVPAKSTGQQLTAAEFNLVNNAINNNAGDSETRLTALEPAPEVGIFTPVFVNFGTGTYQVQVGTYVKIGKLVFCTLNLDVNVLGTASGDIKISGLPFASANIVSGISTASTIYGVGFGVVRSGLVAFLAENKTEIDVFYGSGEASTPRLQHSDLGTGGLTFSLVYRAA